MPAIQGARQDTFRVTLVVDGVDFGVWDKKTGGKTVANSVSYKPGGMGPQKNLGGVPTVENITLERNYEYVRDHDRLPQLLAAVGKGMCVVKQLPLDADGHAYGRPIVTRGRLDDVQGGPDTDSTATNPAMISVTIAPDGPVTA